MADMLELIKACAEASASAAEARDEAIRKAHANGATIRAIAASAGLSSTRVHQIIHAREGEAT